MSRKIFKIHPAPQGISALNPWSNDKILPKGNGINASAEKLWYRVYFIGIGGIGISGLARLFLVGGRDFLARFVGTGVGTGHCPVPTNDRPRPVVQNIVVTGSDLVASEMTRDLEKLGAKIIFGKHKKDNLYLSPTYTSPFLKKEGGGNTTGPDLIIYSSAVPKDNPELKEARRLKIPCLTYAQALGQLTKRMFTIAVSGMHGKSTTASMLALILEKAGLDPTAIIGTRLREWQGANSRLGKSPYLVIEADEWQASFLNYWPKIIVLTNIEEEHLDYYKNLSDILRTFREYIGHLPKDGYLVANGDDKNIQKLLNSKVKSQISKIQIKNLPRTTIRGQKSSHSQFSIPNSQFYFLHQPEAEELRRILRVPGEHNILNALAALTTGRVLGIKDAVSLKALADFKGTWRRFEQLKIKNLKFKIISDYAHHPTEIKATLQAARAKWPDKKIWVVFQPHQYQRTYYLFDKFVAAFDQANNLILVKIYDVAGREKSDLKKKVSAKKLAQAIQERDQQRRVARKIFSAETLTEAKQLILDNVKSDDLLIIMGAGDVYQLVQSLSTGQ